MIHFIHRDWIQYNMAPMQENAYNNIKSINTRFNHEKKIMKSICC